MTRKYTAFAALSVLMACSQDGAASPQQAKTESCGAIEKERATFREQIKDKADKLKVEIEIENSNSKSEAYPKLEDAQKLLEFQTEVEAGENKFAVRLRECSKG